MPISFKQAGSLFVGGANINIFPSGNTFAISGSPFQGGIGSGITGVTSAGTGQYLFLLPNLSENNILQKAISAGTGMNISEDGLSEILTFSVNSANFGSAVTGLTSAGTGNRLIFSSITNNNLVQKSLSGGTGIAIIDSGTGTLTFSSTSTASGTIISGTNAGTGVAIFSAASGSNLVFRRILSGSNIGVYLSGNDIVISGSSGAINGVTGVTNVGGGGAILSSVTSGILYARTILGSNGIDVVESGNNIIVRPVTTTTANRLFFVGTSGALTVDDEFQIDATNGTMTIGFTAPQNNTTSRLLLAGGTAAISQIRLTAFSTAYSGTTAGDIWYNSTSGNSLFFNKSAGTPTPFIFKDNNNSLTGTTIGRILEADINGTLSATRVPITIGVFNVITSKTISNTTVETSILTTGGTFMYGTNLLNSSNHASNPQLIAGKKYRFNSRGIISGISGTFYGKMQIGSVLIASSNTFTLSTSLSGGSYFEIDTTFTITDVGATGKTIGSGKFLTNSTSLDNDVTRQIVGINSLGSVTINTTSDQYFDFIIDFSTASTTNAVVINEATLEYLN
jgi:hypothetical protein